MKNPIINSYLLARRGKVKPPGEGFLSVGNLSDRQVGPAGLEQVIQVAFVFRGKVLDKDQGKAEIRRQYGEKTPDRIETSCRSAYGYDGAAMIGTLMNRIRILFHRVSKAWMQDFLFLDFIQEKFLPVNLMILPSYLSSPPWLRRGRGGLHNYQPLLNFLPPRPLATPPKIGGELGRGGL